MIYSSSILQFFNQSNYINEDLWSVIAWFIQQSRKLDHIWFRIDTKFISFLYECLRQKFYSFEIFSLIALCIRAWLTISHIQQELTLPFIQKHTSFQMIHLWSAFCIGRNKIYYIMHVLNDNNYGMKNFQFHFNDSLLFFLECNFLRNPRILLQTRSNLNCETCWILKLLLINIGNDCVAKYGNI